MSFKLMKVFLYYAEFLSAGIFHMDLGEFPIFFTCK